MDTKAEAAGLTLFVARSLLVLVWRGPRSQNCRTTCRTTRSLFFIGSTTRKYIMSDIFVQ